MLHQFDANAIVHQKQQNEQHHLHSQQQQQQQQRQEKEQRQLQQQQQQQQVQQQVHPFALNTLEPQTPTPSREPSGFIQERYSGTSSNELVNINNNNNSQITTPLLLNPTILASQDQELHPHSTHPHHQPHLYNNSNYGQLQTHMLQNMMIKGSPYEFDSVFQRKRSLSVPMLFPPLDQSNGSPSGSSDTATITATESEVTTAAIPGNSGVDHDMETDDGPKPVKLFSRSERMKQLMDELREHQESATRVLKSHHNRHRNYAGYPSWCYKNGQNQYTLRHHLHYNPHSYRKFPPYQYWAASAQRNYHMATIGVIPSSISPEFRAIAEATQNGLMAIESALLAFAGGRPPPGVGDRILRTSVRNGGVNKSTVASAYPSRLPVHFRHMTSRTNRRPAICINPLQGDASTTSEQKQVSTAGSAVSKVLPLFSGLSIEESNAPSDSGSASTSASSLSNRKKLTDWRRVAGLNIDLGGSSQDDDGTGNTMRLARNDSGSDSKSLGGSLTKGITSSRNWMNKRGGLANLLQTKQSQNGDVGGTSGSGSGTGSTVDRLVEEMNKWSV